jgi:hypothetical protein
LFGDTASGGNLTLTSTSHATKGKIFFGASSAYDGTGISLGIGTTSPSAAIHALSTTEQLRLGYDTSSYASFTTASTGGITLSTVTSAAAGAPITLTPSASNTAGSAGGAMTVRSGAGTTTGTGGAGGTLSILGGAADGDGTVSRVGGPIAITAGLSKGSGAGGGITITTGTGGTGTGTAGANGGQGLLVGGTGGIGSATSGNGGASLINGGVGGAGVVGGTGGLARLLGGAGGAGSSTGCTGGAALMQAGPGGATVGASGGTATITGGTGSGTGTGGGGGTVTLNGGVAQGDNTVSRSGGSVIVLAGASRGSAQGGAFTMFAGAGGPGTGAVGAIGGDVNVLGGVGGNNATTSGAGGDTIFGGGTGGTTGTPGAGGVLIFKTAATVTLSERMRITNTGYVGIGVATPVSILEASETTGGVLTLSRNDSGITADDMIGKIQFYAPDTSSTTNKIVADIEAQATNTVATDINPGRLIFRTTSTTVAATPTERMRIDETGKVGIGVSPTYQLDVMGTTTRFGATLAGDRTDATLKVNYMVTPQYTNANTSFLAFGSSSGSSINEVFYGGGTSSYNCATLLSFYTAANQTTVSGTERMRVNSSGNVGIGTTTVSARLHAIATTEQLRLGFDSSNYVTYTVGSTGALTVAPVGTNAGITFSPSGTGNLKLSTGMLSVTTTGTSPVAGNAALVGGTKAVLTDAVTANTIVMLTRKTSGGIIGTSITYTLQTGAPKGFTISSDNILDTSTFSWFLVEGF